MQTLALGILIFANTIGRAVPTEVRCVDVASHMDVGAGSFLDPQESIAVVQLAESYERGCADKVISLAKHRDEQETAAEIKAGALGAAAGASPLLLLLRRRKSVAKSPPPVAS